MSRTILVTGATGKQGGAVARQLLRDGWDVRALTRSPDKEEAQDLYREGAEVVKGDLNNRFGLRRLLEDVYGVFSVQQPWEHGVKKESIQGIALAEEAKQAGVAHFVYSSVGSAHRNTGIAHFESKWSIEEHIRSTWMQYTILRPVYFMENFLTPQTLSEIQNGTLSLGLNPERSLQLVAVDDIGVFATLAFNNPEEYIGRELDIAGDQLSGPQMAYLFAKLLGRDVKYKQISIEQLKKTIGEDYALMFEWFNKKGYEANIASLRKNNPRLKTLRQWSVEHIVEFEYEDARA